MNVIIAPRQSGKTTKLLKLAAVRGGIIITHNHDTVRHLMYRASELGLTIKKPVSLYDVRQGEKLRGYEGEVYIDDVDLIIHHYIGGYLPIHAITMTGVGEEITERETAPQESPQPPVTMKRTVMIG